MNGPADLAKVDVPSPDHLPHGIKGLALYPVTVIDLMWPLVILILALLLLGVWLWRRRKKAPAPVPIQDPVQVGLARLRSLAPPEPFEGKVRPDYFYQLSLAFRHFIELMTKVPATDLTTTELKGPLRRQAPLRGHSDEIIAFLERADIIKFADGETSLSEARACHAKVVSWAESAVPALRWSAREDGR